MHNIYGAILKKKKEILAYTSAGLLTGTWMLGCYLGASKQTLGDLFSTQASAQETPKEPTFEEILQREVHTNQMQTKQREPYALFPNGEKYTFYDEATLDSYKSLVKTQEKKQNKTFTLADHLRLLEEMDDVQDTKYKTIITPKEVERKQ